MRAQIIEAKRAWFMDDMTEDAKSSRKVPDAARQGIVDTLGDELGQEDLALRELGSEHAEGSVTRPGLITGVLDDSLEHGGELQVRPDREDGIENTLHLAHVSRRSLRP